MLWKEYEDVLLEREDNVATILLNNPANMNPVTVSTMDHLVDALTLCEEDDTVRVIVLRGAGGNFSAGGNVKGMKERLDKGINTTKEGIRAGGEFMMRLRTINKPTIAWIEGAAAGAGMSMALCCDFALAAEDANRFRSGLWYHPYAYKECGPCKSHRPVNGWTPFYRCRRSKMGNDHSSSSKGRTGRSGKEIYQEIFPGTCSCLCTDQENDQQLHYERIKCLHAGRSRSSVHLQQDRRLQDRC